MSNYRSTERARFKNRMRTLNRAVLMGAAVLVPLYLLFQLTKGPLDRLEELPQVFDRLKNPLVWEVPEDGVRYLDFFHGEPAAGKKFVLIEVHMTARLKIGYPVVPRCFRLVDDENTSYYPLSRSPLFIEHGIGFHLDRDDKIVGEVLFEIPRQRQSSRLLFDRYSDAETAETAEEGA